MPYGLDPSTGYPLELTYDINSNGDTISSVVTGGYGPTSQEVLIPAFLAAYGIKNSLTVDLDPMPSIPLPNWRITYDGFIKIPFIKKNFRTFTLGHSYRSTYSVGNYISNLDYGDGDEINLNKL